MKKEEAELKLRKYHAKLFAKGTDKNSKSTTVNERDVFEVFRILSKRYTTASSLTVI